LARERGEQRPPLGPGLPPGTVEPGDRLEEWRPDPHDVARERIWRLMRNGFAIHVVRLADPG